MSTKAKLARRVLQLLSNGESVSQHEALQLRIWAVTPEDAMLTLGQIALRVLSDEEKHKAPTLSLKSKHTPYPNPNLCEERQRLNRTYLGSTTKVFDVVKAAPYLTSSELRQATKSARMACKAALADLKRHRKEHGC